MNRPVLLMLAVLAVLSVPRLSAAEPPFTTTLDTVWAMGDTRYLMEEPRLGVSSELVFPLQTLVEGVRFRYSRHPWALEASFHTNLINPIGIMQDYDWYMYSGYPKVPIIYTESSAAMRWYLASAEAQFDLRSGAWGRVALAFGYRFQLIKQEIIGFKGWEYIDADENGEPEELDLFSDPRHALDYQIIYNTVTAGLALTLNPAPPVAVIAEAGFALPYVCDRDDHLLRHKLSTASGIGYGGYAELEARYTWSPASSRLRPFLALSGSGLWLFAKTRQIQYWYTGATEETPGTTYPPVDHQISTRQYRVAFIIGLQFGTASPGSHRK